MTQTQQMKTKQLLSKLNFESCIELFEKLEVGNPMEGLVMERMEELDEERFIQFSLEY